MCGVPCAPPLGAATTVTGGQDYLLILLYVHNIQCVPDSVGKRKPRRSSWSPAGPRVVCCTN